MRITNIEWNIEGKRGIVKTLPEEVQFNDKEFEDLLDNTEEELEANKDLIEVIADKLSNQYGWYVYSFNIRTEEQYMKEKVKELENKKKITKMQIIELKILMNDYNENILDGNYLTVVYNDKNPKKELLCLRNEYTKECVKIFKTNRECFNYLKEKI